jgi:prepilin-type N-terminal cleavage/methylation domain-containing protein
MLSRTRSDGFTLVDMLMTLSIFGVLAAMALPTMTDVTGALTLNAATREIERELQTARLKAVTTNNPIRVRFNFPVTNQFRMVELIGSTSTPDASDAPLDRCSDTKFPYPAPDTNPLTRPNNDGPLRRLDSKLTFGTVATLEFRPDGTVYFSNGAKVPDTGTALTVKKGTTIRTITVNGLGKIQIQQ